LAEVKRIPIEVARDTAVLNADDPLCVRMAAHTRARSVCYVTMHPENALVREHIRAGGRAIALEGGVNGQMITIYDKGSHIPLLWTHLIPATLEGKAIHNVQNAMFAAGMAYSMGVRLDDIRHGLRTFDSSFFQTPGRMNVFDQHGFRVIVDYGHNPAAIEAMCTLVDRMSETSRGRRTVVLAAPGDRRDEDILTIATRAARSFDHFICRRDDNPRGRGPDEVPRLLAQGLRAAGIPDDRIQIIETEEDSVDAALKMSQKGDLVLVFADKVTRTWKQVIYFGGAKEVEPQRTESPVVEPARSPAPSLAGLTLLTDERGVIAVAEEAD